jgi:hypothetical protein
MTTRRGFRSIGTVAFGLLLVAGLPGLSFAAQAAAHTDTSTSTSAAPSPTR